MKPQQQQVGSINILSLEIWRETAIRLETMFLTAQLQFQARDSLRLLEH